jgi:hypothetical protein
MNKLKLDLSDLNVSTFAIDATTARGGTVEGQVAPFTADCELLTDDEPNCPIVFTEDVSGCIPCIPKTEQVDCFYE